MPKIKEVTVTGMEMVVQDNRLIDSPRFFSLQEQRLFILLVSKLNPKNQKDITFRLPTIEFAKALDIDEKDAVRDLKRITKNLMKRVIEIYNKDENSQTFVHIVSFAKYWLGKGYADIKISDEITPYLFQLKERFTTYKLTQVTRLSSIYAIRIYEILKKHEKIGSRKIFIDDLRKLLAIKDTQYKKFNDFSKRILDIAKKEINTKTDLEIDYKLIKNGRKFEVIEFFIQPKNPTENSPLYYIPRYYDDEIIEKMTSLGLTKAIAKNIFDKYSPRDIENAIEVVKQNISSGKCDNPAGMLKIAIQKRWKPKISRETSSLKFVNDEEEISKQPQSESASQKPITKKKKKFSILEKLLKSFNS